MALYVIGDLHLSLGGDKAMDIFEGWSDYVEKIEKNWRATVTEEDTVVVAGDISWGMTLEEALPDFAFIHNLPGKQKILLKGNHDYWWSTRSKMERFFEEQGFGDLAILHNNFFEVEGIAICGSRGWLFEQGDPHDQKVVAREVGRLAASLRAAKDSDRERVAFLHYPPIYGEQQTPEVLDLLMREGIRRCYYGHLHGASRMHAFEGELSGTKYRLISADHVGFCPQKVL